MKCPMRFLGKDSWAQETRCDEIERRSEEESSRLIMKAAKEDVNKEVDGERERERERERNWVWLGGREKGIGIEFRLGREK